MFERFTDEARRTIVRALVEARRLGHSHVGTEHTLLALAAGKDAAADALAAEGVTLERARAAVSGLADGTRMSSPWDDGPYTARAKHTFELGQHEAFAMGHPAIAPGHLLLAMLRMRDGNGVRALQSLDVDLDALQDKIEAGVHVDAADATPPPRHRATLPAGRLGIHHQAIDGNHSDPSPAPAVPQPAEPAPAMARGVLAETDTAAPIFTGRRSNVSAGNRAPEASSRTSSDESPARGRATTAASAIDRPGAASTTLTCSFCQRTLGNDTRYVAVVAAAICDSCVAACSHLLRPPSPAPRD